MGKQNQPPKGSAGDGLVREYAEPRLELRASQGMKMPTLFGYIIRFDEPTEIDSWEGKFIERISPGAAKKTLKEHGDSIKILFDHGHDPNIGNKPLAKPQWEEDTEGVKYEGVLFDCDYCRELVPGLEAGQYGASFKFRVIKESFDEEPEPSDENPDGLPERTIEELQLYEGGPVVFPAYASASAGVRSRSGTARIFMERAKADPAKVPELVELFTEWVREDPDRVRDLIADPAKPDDEDDTTSTEPGDAHSDDTTPAAGEQPESTTTTEDDRAATEHSDDDATRSTGAGTDHSSATTKRGRLYGDVTAPSWRL